MTTKVHDIEYLKKDLHLTHHTIIHEKRKQYSKKTHHELQKVLHKTIDNGQEDPFIVIDLSEIKRRHQEWKEHLPRVKPFYAMKCNPNYEILKVMAKLGMGFDCASKEEISTILGLGVPPEKIIFANPCKMIPHLEFARQRSVRKMTFDSIEEMVKIAKIMPEAELVLRIKTDDKHSLAPLSTKFGMEIKDVKNVLERSIEMKVNIIGIAFHVGSNCQDANSYVETLKITKSIFDIAKDLGISFSFLDIGGGFPPSGTFYLPESVSFADVADTVAPLVDSLFDDDITVIAEPGRYFATSCQTIALNVYAKRKKFIAEHPSFQYFISDGLYGTLNNVVFDHYDPRIYIYRKIQSEEELYESSLFGPTCDSIDCIKKSLLLPELDIGDWIIFYDMGAYTTAATTRFNGFNEYDFKYIETDMK
ncbi:ornithine decarboxylase 1-related [Anaeramoeba ignava]|uniref:ornithine decarboxylase n=1 Tax=Anaeramoeba ignava TaxID=1746090 RepID=A0A9Q0R5Y3_ANAIG|nr:ornithine decarboxylase 1-related [Anaeramoeba ignava]|eukprot:Anaeramoba_ignava/a608495_92.p1 GENE.a608495_92~~a608495_92.p1  ORF type:complete len:420 (+),score=107.20 a608495_92:97-1356(+)